MRILVQWLLSVNPLVTNGLSNPYHLDESIFNFRGFGINFSFSFHFPMKIMAANTIAPDGTPRFVASHLGLFCLPMSHKKFRLFVFVLLNVPVNSFSVMSGRSHHFLGITSTCTFGE